MVTIQEIYLWPLANRGTKCGCKRYQKPITIYTFSVVLLSIVPQETRSSMVRAAQSCLALPIILKSICSKNISLNPLKSAKDSYPKTLQRLSLTTSLKISDRISAKSKCS